MRPGYLKLHTTGELEKRIEKARSLLHCCTVCPQNCRVDRVSGTLGKCGVGRLAPVSSYGPHFGEESPLVGSGGSGTIFFSSCNLLCIFCQNYDISHFAENGASHLHGRELAEIMVHLQLQGCHNINFVTPSHVVPQILEALPHAIEMGLDVPLVYNSSGYDAPETLALLDSVIDIYMPDFKFWSNETAENFTAASDYADVTRAAISAMYDQVGDLLVDEKGIARKGLLIRHLVMPGHLEETERILTYISESISPRCHVNIMDQYRPCGRATPPIDRSLSPEEFQHALNHASKTRLVQLNENRISDLLRRLGIV